MKISVNAIKEFQELYEEEYGESLSEQVARECLINLLSIFKVIYRPVPDGEMKRYERMPKRKIHTNTK